MEQLKMTREDLDGLPEISLPEGCSIRIYQPGDEQAWADIMNTGIGSDWTVEKVREDLLNQPQFDPECLFFATKNGKAVGSACAWKDSPEENTTGLVHMVCVLPEARGLNLGYLLVLRVLHCLRDKGFKNVYLTTDDYRVPAIKSYLRLGFQPFYYNAEHAIRWKKIMEAIGNRT